MRFLLFAGSQHYPLGGWKDFVGSFKSKDEAWAAAFRGGYGWMHIVLDNNLLADPVVIESSTSG